MLLIKIMKHKKNLILNPEFKLIILTSMGNLATIYVFFFKLYSVTMSVRKAQKESNNIN